MIKTIRNHPMNGNQVFPKMYNGFFDAFLQEALGDQKQTESVFKPRADVIETPSHFKFNVALPGLRKEDLSLEIIEDRLKVSAERKIEKTEGESVHLQETFFGKFERQFKLPKNVDLETIQANFSDGILNIAIEKREEEKKSSKIEIK